MGIFLIVIFCIFVIVMIGAISWFWKIRHQQVNAIASIVTVIGVLGTFAGITYALFEFNTKNIEASVPQLLNGLKFAFVTSILGIVGSIALKWSALNNQKLKLRQRKLIQVQQLMTSRNCCRIS